MAKVIIPLIVMIAIMEKMMMKMMRLNFGEN